MSVFKPLTAVTCLGACISALRGNPRAAACTEGRHLGRSLALDPNPQPPTPHFTAILSPVGYNKTLAFGRGQGFDNIALPLMEDTSSRWPDWSGSSPALGSMGTGMLAMGATACMAVIAGMWEE